MNQKAGKSFDIREYWQIFWKKKLYFFIPLAVCMIGGIIYAVVARPIYQSSTMVQVSQSQLLSNAMKRLVPGVTEQERLQNLRKLITSYEYLRRLIKTLNLDTSPDMQANAEKQKSKYPGYTKEEIVELMWIDLLRRFLIIRTSGTDFIQIVAQAQTPELAYNLAQTLTQIFIDESLRREVGGIRGAIEFSSEQLALYEKRLKEAEDRLQRFRESVVSDQFENKAVLTANIDQVNLLLSATDFELREARDRLAFLDTRIRSQNISYTPPGGQTLVSLKAQLSSAVLELSKLMLQYTWQDAKVLKTNAEIDALQDNIRREIEAQVTTKLPENNSSQAELIVQKEVTLMDIALLERKQEVFNNLLRIYKTSLAKGPERELIEDRLQRDVAENRDIYQTLLRQTRGSEIEEALQKTASEFKFKIVEPAIKPIKPEKPNRVRIVVMAMFLGAAIGLGIISLLEAMDHSFKNVESVEEYLKLPVLGTIPKIDTQIEHKWV